MATMRENWLHESRANRPNEAPRMSDLQTGGERLTSQCSGPGARVARAPAADRERWAENMILNYKEEKSCVF